MKHVCCHGSQEANNKGKHQYKLAVGNICLTPFINSTYYIAIILVCHFSSLLLYIDMIYKAATMIYFLIMFISPVAPIFIIVDGWCGLCSCRREVQT